MRCDACCFARSSDFKELNLLPNFMNFFWYMMRFILPQIRGHIRRFLYQKDLFPNQAVIQNTESNAKTPILQFTTTNRPPRLGVCVSTIRSFNSTGHRHASCGFGEYVSPSVDAFVDQNVVSTRLIEFSM